MKTKTTTPNNEYTAADFRNELKKLLPGYNWTVHKGTSSEFQASGIQSAGFNRLSTIEVNRFKTTAWYKTFGYGYGTRVNSLGTSSGATLAQAIRSLQEGLENMGSKLLGLAGSIEAARKTKP